MRAPFLLRVHADTEDAARALADRLEARLAARDARVALAWGRRALPGTVVNVGVRDAEGRPRWVAPLRVAPDVDVATRETIAFLERWGFVEREAPAAADAPRDAPATGAPTPAWAARIAPPARRAWRA